MAGNDITFRIEGQFSESRLFTFKTISEVDGYNLVVAIV